MEIYDPTSIETDTLRGLARRAKAERLPPGEATLNYFFERTREKPFEVVLKPSSVFSAQRHALEFDRGGCSQKNLTLAAMLIRLGFKDIEFIRIPFRWVDQTIFFPENLKKLAEQMSITYHTILAVKVPWQESRLHLDATWDKFMREELGFPSSRSLGIIPAESGRQNFRSLDELDAHLKIRESHRSQNEIDTRNAFYQALDAWIAEKRSLQPA